jgi:hypothetical protein
MRVCRIMARMTSRRSCALLSLATTFAAAPLFVRAQTTPANTRLSSARALYYTPTVQGLKSFRCTVNFDWKDFLTRFSGGGADVNDDNPLLQYMRTVHLTVSDNLNGDGHLDWTATGTAPAGKEESIARMKDGMQQMMVGFFSSWNAYMNGNMVPLPDSTTTVAENGDWLKLHAATEGAEVTELFDKNLLLTEAHVVQPTSDVFAYPTYDDTPDGRVVSAIRTVYRQPPTAPPAELNIRVSYAPVQGFRLPETLSYELKNVGSFVFKFSACYVQKTDKAPDKL